MSEQYFTRPNVKPVITYIGTTPEQRQMSTDEFKAKFDEMTVNLQNYIKETLLTELDAFKQEFMTHLADIESPHPIYAKKKQENWKTPTLLNGWSGNVKYRKNEFGNLEFKGVITGGVSTAGTTLFSLPTGYYNSDENIRLACLTYTSTSVGVVLVQIGADSLVKIIFANSQSSISFDGVTVNLI